MKKIRGLKPEEIEVRVGRVTSKGCSLLLYKTARTDQDILDETFGSENWQNKYYELKGNIYCSIGIKDDNKEWIWKDNCGAESNTEKEKGEASDSFKRAGFNWNIGRELYDSPFIWISSATKQNNRGGYELVDKFQKWSVSKIEIDKEKNKIVSLIIANKDGTPVYRCGITKSGKRVGVNG